MALRKKQPEPQPCPLADRLAELEAVVAALVTVAVCSNRRAKGDTIERGLTGSGIPLADARRIAEAYRQRTA